MPEEPTIGAFAAALDEARRREKLSQAQWRRRRAELARLMAAGEEAAAAKLLRDAGVDEADLPPVRARLSRRSDAAARSVSAGEPAAAVRAAARAGEVNKPHAEPKPHPEREPSGKPEQGKQPAARKPAARKPARKQPASVGLKHRVRTRARRRRAARRAGWVGWLRARPPWLMSLGAHAVLLTVLGLLSFSALGEPVFELTALAHDDQPFSETPSPVELLDAALDAPLTEAAPLLAEVDVASLLEPVELAATDALADSLALDPSALAATVPAAAAGQGSGEGDSAGGGEAEPADKAGKVSFFGAESAARRVAFVVDNSGSMKGGRLETTLIELDRAVQGLSSSQEFYVVFYSDQAYPMFFPQGVEAPIPASLENKRRLSRWLESVEMCLGGRIVDAMELAAKTEPEVVYLLTDGDIRSKWVVERLTTPGQWPFKIHTLGMGARTAEHLAILQTIASVHGGQYRPAQAIPAAVRRAAARPIRYHRTPGKVWGSAVQPWD
ncbi:hypothetical protein [Botrimarina sp.]|uniref:hypothetical protein n=1 Tax=Botrimarina sp. TaxID=2795802 RepID=UPI0032F097E7